MMVYPPIDKLIKKAECRYALTCAVAKRAHYRRTGARHRRGNRRETNFHCLP